MTKTIGIGILGMGWMGEVHSRCYLLAADRFREKGFNPRLVVCAESFEARARAGQERFGFERYTTDWKDVINDPEVQAVNITTPNALHREMALAAAAAGKHIFCEKPVGLDPYQVAEIELAAREAGVRSGVGYNYRWAPVVQYARQMISEGKIGAITHYRGRFLVGYARNPNGVLSWRFEREHSGLGTLGDLMSHVVDMAHMIAGPIKRVVSSRETFIKERPLATPGEGTHFTVSEGGPMGPVTNEDYVGALANFANGAYGSLEACRVVNGPACELAFEVNGTEGAISWDFERMNELSVYLPDSEGAHKGYTSVISSPEHPFHGNFNPGWALGLGYEDLKVIEIAQFMESVMSGEQGEPGFAEALAVADVNAAMMRSWDSDKWEDVTSLKKA
ncbi:MAG: Gfo/Idh/MocA family oxidoreductase [Anaerolineales bacterium]|nr:Gfo/Idh/MocA family oxidoreductase [Anaerolineales bacterium]